MLKLNEKDMAILALPRKQLEKLNDFINKIYTKDGVVRDIPHKEDLDFLNTLTDEEHQMLIDLSDLNDRIHKDMIKQKQYFSNRD